MVRHSLITARSTGRSRSNRRRTARVVVSSSSGERSRVALNGSLASSLIRPNLPACPDGLQLRPLPAAGWGAHRAVPAWRQHLVELVAHQAAELGPGEEMDV